MAEPFSLLPNVVPFEDEIFCDLGSGFGESLIRHLSLMVLFASTSSPGVYPELQPWWFSGMFAFAGISCFVSKVLLNLKSVLVCSTFEETIAEKLTSNPVSELLSELYIVVRLALVGICIPILRCQAVTNTNLAKCPTHSFLKPSGSFYQARVVVVCHTIFKHSVAILLFDKLS